MMKLALFAFAAGAAVTMSSMASAQYYEQPRHYQERQHYRPDCPHGYKYEHGRCVQVYVRPHCEDGYTYRDGHCRPVYRQRHYNSY